MIDATCGWCTVRAHMTLVWGPHRVWREHDRLPLNMAAFTCDACDHVSLAQLESNEFRSDEELGFQAYSDQLKWMPARGTPKAFEDVPDHIAAAASEAYECHSIGAHRAAVQLARSVVEASAKEVGVTNGTLAAKINDLDARRVLRPHITEAAHEIRHLGNEMAHGDFVLPVTEEESAEVLGLMAEILHEVFQSPARVARRQQARMAREQQNGTTV